MKDFLRLNVEAVVADWQSLDPAPTDDQVDAILEVAYLAIASDGVVTRTEMEAFAVVMEQLFGPDVTAARIEAVLDGYESSLDHAGFNDRLTDVTQRLQREDLRDKAYQLAYSMVMCDLDTNIHEFEFDQVLREQLGLDEQTAEELVDGVVDLIMVPL